MAPSRIAGLRVADLMAAPLALSDASSVRDAAIFLARGGTSVVPVVSTDGTFTGVFGESDIHRRLSDVTRGFHSPEEFRTCVPFLAGSLPDSMWDKFARVGWLSVADLRREVRPIESGDSVPMALEAMGKQGVSALPVLEKGELVGIFHADALTLRLMEFALGHGDRRRGGRGTSRRAVVPSGPPAVADGF